MMMIMRRCFLLSLLISLTVLPSFRYRSCAALPVNTVLVQRRHTTAPGGDTVLIVTRRPSSSWLLLHMTAANENAQHKISRQQPQPQQQQDYDSNSNSNNNNNNYILQDSTGHVNGELAERIWNWEQELRQKRKLPPVQYSIRTGLRLVDQAVQEIILLQQQDDDDVGNDDYNNDNINIDNDSDNIQNSALYSDLIQEGLSALLDAMSHYRADHYQQENDNDSSSSSSSAREKPSSAKNNKQVEETVADDFEAYALQEIRSHLAFVLNQEEQDSHARHHHRPSPLRLPQSIRSVLKRAKQVAATLASEQRKPTLQSVAERMNMDDDGDVAMPVEQLRDYLRMARLSSRRLRRRHRRRYTPLSVESTVKISYDRQSPFLQDSSPTYTDQEEWELREGLFLNKNNRHMLLHRDDELIDIESFLDESVEYEGDDEAWIRQQAQIAGPLQDLIPDTEGDETSSSSLSPQDDLALAEMIRHDVREFLTSTLNENEHQVVRLVFGLDTGGRQMSMKKTASNMGISTAEVSSLLQVAMRKLRESYTERYASDPYLDDDDYGNTVDSV